MTHTTETQRIRNYYKQLQTNKLNDLEKKDKVLERQFIKNDS